ncbi:nucleoside-diphosphate-sugar epimerase [Mangrovibacterium marinum]|uniref:Nucleoside-diphosphate-sugar epimerase n=2 Tax=Mangrovibacterium marinum TaxID=1639118 RepID=A0A2T5BY87_9BACT|nr:nucleoside-diphosphate-sugar epimerase [Mangrovibacterium marinum]
METVSILGVGWLGLPLAKRLISDGYQVKGSVTTAEKMELLQQAAIWPYQLIASPENLWVNDASFFNADVLIISIPPRRIPDIESIFPRQIGYLINELEKTDLKKVIFISSTSVYPDEGQQAVETDTLSPQKASGRALVEAENLFRQNSQFKTTIIRFGGLIGADRNPARFLARRKTAVDGRKPVNLIHQDDCIAIIREIIRQNIWGETFNACCPEHPTRREFYLRASLLSGIPAPDFEDGNEAFKIVNSQKLVRYLDYEFKFPSPLDYLNRTTI